MNKNRAMGEKGAGEGHAWPPSWCVVGRAPTSARAMELVGCFRCLFTIVIIIEYHLSYYSYSIIMIIIIIIIIIVCCCFSRAMEDCCFGPPAIRGTTGAEKLLGARAGATGFRPGAAAVRTRLAGVGRKDFGGLLLVCCD